MVATRLYKKNAATSKPTRSYQDVAFQFPWIGSTVVAAPGSEDSSFAITCEDSNYNGGPHGSVYWVLQMMVGPDAVEQPVVVVPVLGQGTLIASAPGFPLRVTDSSAITFSISGTPGAWTMPNAVDDNQLIFTRTAPETDPGTGLYSVTIVASGDLKYGTWGSTGTFGSAGDPLSFTRVGNDLLVILATDGGGTILSTASDVMAAWPYGGDVTIGCTGDGSAVMNNFNLQEWLLGSFSKTFTLTADDHDWSIQYNNFYPLPDRTTVQSRGYFWMIKVKKVAAGSTYAKIGDGFRPQYPPSDDSGMMDYTTALALAQTIYPATTGWEFTNGVHAAIEGGSTFPSTIKAGVKFSASVTFVDPRVDGLSLAGDTLRGVDVVPSPSGFGLFHDPATSPSDGVWDLTNCQIFIVGGYEITASSVFSAPVNPARNLYFGHITVTPGDPHQLVVGDAYANPPYSGGPVIAEGGARRAIRGQRVDGTVDVAVGTTSAFSIQVQDTWGNVCTDMTPAVVTVAVSDLGSPAITPVVGGTLTATTVDGIASFKDLVVTGLTKTAKLVFTSPGLATLEVPLMIAVFGLVTSPPTAKVGDTITVTYQLADWNADFLTPSSPDPVTIADGPHAGGFVPAAAFVSPDSSGLATFTGTFPSPGTFDLRLAGTNVNYPDPGKLSPRIVVSA